MTFSVTLFLSIPPAVFLMAVSSALVLFSLVLVLVVVVVVVFGLIIDNEINRCYQMKEKNLQK